MNNRPTFEASTNHERPKCYLDVDGVINVYGPDTEGLATASVRTAAGRTYLARYSPERVEELDDLIRELDVDLVWLTTWLHEGLVTQLVDHLGALQGGRLLKAPLPRMSGFPYRWKVQRLLADQRVRLAPFCWIDDEQEDSAKEARRTFDVPSLLLQPNALEGLSPMHLQSMRSFYEGL